MTPHTPSKQPPEDETAPALSFEDALRQIEQIVDDLERGEAELSSALSKYEIAMRLLGQCYGLLNRAERTVEILTGSDPEGRLVSSPFDAPATVPRETKTGKSPRSDDDQGDRQPDPGAPSPAGKRRRQPRPTGDTGDPASEVPF